MSMDAGRIAGTARIVVIGSGHSAGRLIGQLKSLGHRGQIVLIGEEAHPPYERPWLSKTMLTEPEEPAIPGVLSDTDGVTHLPLRRAVAIDRAAGRVRLDDGSDEAYDILVLATGLAPRRLAIFDGMEDRVLCLHKLDEARALRARLARGGGLALIGAGFIGLEVASSARQLGLAVDIVETAPLPLMRALPAALGRQIADLHAAEGSRLHLGTGLQSAETEAGSLRLSLTNGHRISAETVVLGMGGTAQDGLARDSGLDTADGVLTDATGRSSDPQIYAIGDVARCRSDENGQNGIRLESWRNAEDSAIAAAAAILDAPPPPPPGAPSFWTEQLGQRIQFIGQPVADGELWQSGEAFRPGYGAFLMRDDCLHQAVFVNAPKVMRAAREAFRRDGRIAADTLSALGFRRI
ncbi:FAD-dependent oxidoreductase [Pseudomonas sp. GX19020]|uniref:NAD(P)/FAD-dependent oxidoreductase n=1 Tax=Pseudomonas sp. GX19020 TaxID=2942277 RepID=UPI0020194B9F|nr:FAD-dependent oxidoreductase [Pseudomonas sp. GX19020]MCL4067119.1 FAD-dependent oxidoreductase [Pseudomonas sp. GX19020]